MKINNNRELNFVPIYFFGEIAILWFSDTFPQIVFINSAQVVDMMRNNIQVRVLCHFKRKLFESLCYWGIYGNLDYLNIHYWRHIQLGFSQNLNGKIGQN